MEEQFSTQRLIQLRKLTRAISELLRNQMKDYLSTLAPVLRPRLVLGDYVSSGSKETAKGAEKAFKDLQTLYETVATSKPYNLPPELKPPVEIVSTALEVIPMEYVHEARADDETKRVTVTSPLKWTLTYSGFPLAKLKAMLADRNRSNNEVQQFLLHYLVMHIVMTKQTGAMNILDALHFPVRSLTLQEFGQLPITYITAAVSTFRPSDNVIIESTEISGTPGFEEIVSIDDIVKMHDPLKAQLTDLLKSHGEELRASVS